ncbi:MAG: class I SAM-dependent methyltransferase [Azoarcus sp.]|jgi:SAM-dependent methyltransferase|nr:class I SAM-dependent methyltransferase [Azoarcus sp.]
MTNEEALLRDVDRLCTDEAMRSLIARAAFGETAPPPAAFDLRIHPADQMLLHSLRHLGDANAAFSQYYNVALQQYRAARDVMRAIFPGRMQALRILDFACGFGRLLRFLRPAAPQAPIRAAEIQEEALAFVKERFGVETILSAFDPEAFQPREHFDVTWAASLFSHLPPRLFHAWLARLLRLPGEEGIVCFTVHDACLLPDPARMTEDGILFFPSSENPGLDTSVYGTTYVTEAFVREAVARAGGGEFDCRRIPRALAHEQDLYVAMRRGAHDPALLDGFRYGPWGWVDEKRLSAAEGLYLRGWAASLDDGQVDFVDIRVGKQVFRCPTGLPRDDVARVFADPRLAACGWEFRHPVSRDGNGPVRVEATARSACGEMALLYAGDLPPAPAAPPRSLLQRLLGR